MAPRVEDIEVTLLPAGAEPRRLTPILDSMRWTSAAVGGFGSFSCRFPGWLTRRELPYLARLLVTLGPRVLFDGRLEDHEPASDTAGITTEIQGFGWQRLLDETEINRAWVKRDLAWFPHPINNSQAQVGIGAIDDVDPTLIGVKISEEGTNGGGILSRALAIPPIAGSRIRFRYDHSGDTNVVGWFAYGVGGSFTITNLGTTSEEKTIAIPENADLLYFDYFRTSGAGTLTDADYVTFTEIRFIGPTVDEDATGGIYGGTVIRDVLAAVPGLTAGVIDVGSEFLIEHIDRSTPSFARAVLDEVNTYHDREWAVWEDRRLDWRRAELSEPRWVIPRENFASLHLRSSVDTVARRIELIFNDPAAAANVPGAQQLLTSVEAESTDQRNPYVKTGQTKDLIITTGFPMTSRTAQQLANKLITLQGGPPPVTGTAILHADTYVRTAEGALYPAWAMRAGENILIPDLPVDEPLRQGRDGQTLFHIVTADVNLDDRTVTLELDGQGRRADVLFARLAAATRTVTG